jgi:hypothetical protein
MGAEMEVKNVILLTGSRVHGLGNRKTVTIMPRDRVERFYGVETRKMESKKPKKENGGAEKT